MHTSPKRYKQMQPEDLASLKHQNYSIQQIANKLQTSASRIKAMALHKQTSVNMCMTVHFCDPHSLWQRGSSENTNGLVRQYLPKGIDLSGNSQEQLDAIPDEINSRPRKGLCVRSLLWVYWELLLSYSQQSTLSSIHPMGDALQI